MAPQIQTGSTAHPIPGDPPPHPIPIDPLPVLPPQSALTPVMTPTMALFLTKLPASKAAGVAAIRISLVNNIDAQVEELDANGKTIIGFVMHLILKSASQVTGIAITQMGKSASPTQLTEAQRGALSLIANEASQFKASGFATGPAPVHGQRSVLGALKFIGECIGYVAACGAAAAEGGLNPLADAGCVADASLLAADVADSADSGSGGTGDSGAGTGSYGDGSGDDSGSTSSDGGDGGAGGGDGGGGGGGGIDTGPGNDDGSTHEED